MKRKFHSQYYELLRPNLHQVLKPNVRKYALFPNDNAVTSTLINGQIYEKYMFDFLRDNLIDLTGTDVADVGANNGHFTIEFAEFVGDSGRVFSFEPQRIIFQQLCGNIFLNGLDNVYAYNLAIGDKSGPTQIEFPDYHSTDLVNFGNVGLTNNPNVSFETAWAEKLDAINFNTLSVIKIDVQGFEPYVIDGAKETINKHRPYIFIEIEEESLEKFGFTEAQLIKQIEDLQYVVKRFQVGIPYQTRNGVCLDCVCIPKEKYFSHDYIIT